MLGVLCTLPYRPDPELIEYSLLRSVSVSLSDLVPGEYTKRPACPWLAAAQGHAGPDFRIYHV